MNQPARGRRSLADTRVVRFLPPATLAGFLVAVLAVALIAFFTYRAMQSREEAAARVTQTLGTIQALQDVLSNVKDAETGQRGFLLTGEERYLEPYTNARAELPARAEEPARARHRAPRRSAADRDAGAACRRED